MTDLTVACGDLGPETEGARCARLRREAALTLIPDGLYVCRCDHTHPSGALWCYVCEYPTRG